MALNGSYKRGAGHHKRVKMQMEVEMDLAIDEIMCKPPPSGPRKNPNRRLYSKSLPPLYSKPLPPLPAEVFQIAKELIPAPLFSRRNTLTDDPPLTTTTTTTTAAVAPAAPAAHRSHGHGHGHGHRNSHSHCLSPIVLPVSTPSTIASPRLSFHSTNSSPTIFFRSSPPSSSHSSNSSPTPFLRSVSSPSTSSFYSSLASATSTPASTPPTSPVPLSRSLVCTSCSKVCSPVIAPPADPDLVIIPSRPRMMPPSPKKSLKRKKSPRKDTLRNLRAQESVAYLQKTYKHQSGMCLDGLVSEMENLLEGWEEEDEENDD